ncbi:Inosine/uridine-preferring nucleoside hydrolase domain-containing protein [Mrakia frigida]|uniref:Inosine/uridine-preferring nucleoside hydrolase domain-containing protein n=1 Tax=Mrakia frigida TaxID=29902 RepID=UPI003FCBFC16
MSKTILDVDVGVDDALALIMALASPELEILTITAVFGNTLVSRVYDNLQKIFNVLDKDIEGLSAEERQKRWPGMVESDKKILVGRKGAEEPLGGEPETAAYFHGPDGLSNIVETHPEFNLPSSYVHPRLEVSPDSSASVILQTLAKEESGTVTIVALGPLTNIALAHQQDPVTFSRVKRVLWMGAALDVPGNTSPTAEFNLYADPYAGAYIFKACTASNPFHLTILPLDITTPHQVSFTHLLPPADAKPSSSILSNFRTAFLKRVRTIYSDLGLGDAMEMHDPMVVWYAICLAGNPTAPGFEVRRRMFEVERTGEWTRGMCVVDRRGTTEVPLEIRSKSGIHGIHAEDHVTTTPSSDEGVEVVVKTPGTKAFEKMFLERVYGVSV